MEDLRTLFPKVALAIGFKFGALATWSTMRQGGFSEAGVETCQGIWKGKHQHSGFLAIVILAHSRGSEL